MDARSITGMSLDQIHHVVLWAVITLFVSILLMVVYALFQRMLRDRSEAAIARCEAAMQAQLQQHLSGELTGAALVAHWSRRRGRAHRRLMASVLRLAASRREPDEREALRRVFADTGLAADARADLGNGDPAIRAHAANLLGYLGGDGERIALRGALADPDLDTRLEVAQALAENGDVNAAVAILQAIALPGEWPSRRATEILLELGPPVAAPLLRFLSQPSGETGSAAQVVAINALGMLGDARASDALRARLRQGALEVRIACAKALGGIGGADNGEALTQALFDEDWEVRSMAAKSLGRLACQPALPALRSVLPDPGWWVRYNAAEALHALGEPGLRVLRESAEQHPDRFARDICLQVLQEHPQAGARQEATA